MIQRRTIVVGLISLAAAASAQGQSVSAKNSALITRILLAEDRRDSTDAALAEGVASSDARIAYMARRAVGRIRDPRFVARDSLAPLPAPKTWPDPAWRLRFRQLTNKSDCTALGVSLSDGSWPVRLRAMDLMTSACSSSDATVKQLETWIDALPANTNSRTAGNVSWHAAAHGIVALARMRPEEARSRAAKLASHKQWEVRMYSARAFAVLSDVAFLRTLARDADDNVKEAAIDALSKLTGHADDDVYLVALKANGAQAVRAAAIALKGSPREDVRAAANAAFDGWVKKQNASSRDARVALLEAAGRPASDDKPPPPRVEAPPRLVALALGADVKLRVTMSPKSGGGSFVVRLRGDNAPMMAARILALANRRYYDNGHWHRVEHDFVIQGAGPGTNEYVGYENYLRDELGTLPHVRGTVGMSTRGHDSGDAQWFINLRDNLRLLRDYTVFAEVVDGIDVVDGIMEGDIVQSIREVK
jgi:cyclophilin family peptidyl-prolyl cis-trans isomerase